MKYGITLSKNSWHRNFYTFWWAKDAPNDLCNYFWGLLLAVLTVFLIPGRAVYQYLKEKPEESTILTKTIIYTINTLLVSFFAMLLGFIAGNAFFYPEKALTIIGALFLGIGLMFLFIWTYVNVEESETINMAATAIKSKKEKVCPRIDWK